MNDFYLFATPSFLSGVARTLDIAGLFDDYNFSETPAEAEIRAMRSDWLSVGRDIHAAMMSLEAECHAE